MTMAVADDEIDATLEQGLCHVHALPCATYEGTIPEGHDGDGDGEGDGPVQGGTSTGAGASAGKDDPPCMYHSHGATVTFEFSFAGMCLAVDRRLNPVERQQFLTRSLSMVSRRPSEDSEIDGEESFTGLLGGFVEFAQPLPSGGIPSAPSSVTISPSTDMYHQETGAWVSESFPLRYLIAHLEDEDMPQGTTIPVIVGVKCRAIVMPSDDDKQPRSLHAVLADLDEFEFEPVAESTYVLPGTVHMASDVVGVRDEDQGSQSSEEEATSPI